MGRAAGVPMVTNVSGWWHRWWEETVSSCPPWPLGHKPAVCTGPHGAQWPLTAQPNVWAAVDQAGAVNAAPIPLGPRQSLWRPCWVNPSSERGVPLENLVFFR